MTLLSVGSTVAGAQVPAVHNVILFVPDGLRSAIVSAQTAPTMAALRDRGVDFRNSHSLFPTFTTANASAFATGHLLGDTGDFSNTLYAGFALKSVAGSVTPFLENDAVLRELDAHFDDNYLDEETILAAAREAHLQTAAIGKLGPVAIQDHTISASTGTLIVDDRTGQPDGFALGTWAAEFTQAGVPRVAPGRGANGNAGDDRTPGTTTTNVEQQNYFRDVAVKVVLPRFKTSGQPFFLVFWSRDPDGTQHNQGDSLGKLQPGINGPTSLAAIRTADDDLAALRAALEAQGLLATTDIIVAADHGFSTIAKDSATSSAAKATYADVVPGQLPPGFLAIDLFQALKVTRPGLRLFDAVDHDAPLEASQHPKQGSALIGADPEKPHVIVAANGGSDLIYLPQSDAASLAPQVVQALLAEDYTSGVFVDDALGRIPGTLPLSRIGLKGASRTPTPAIVVSFRSFAGQCHPVERCTAEIADTVLQVGQGMHGSFSRADTWNFMAASGPDFRVRFTDRLPASNADVGLTIAQILRLALHPVGGLQGRVLEEALAGGHMQAAALHTTHSAPGRNGLKTVLLQQTVGGTTYNDVAGFAGRTVGLIAR